MSKNEKILVVEDEDDIRDLIHFTLFKEKFDIEISGGGFDAIEKFKKFNPDLVLLDIMMPELSGPELLKKFHEIKPDISCIFVTAKGEEVDEVKGFDLGADDYIIKPFSPKLLTARVKAILKRKKSGKKGDGILKYKDMELDLTSRKFYLSAKEVPLTFSEFEILNLLINNPEVAFSRSEIVDLIRGENHAISDRSVDVQFVGIRRKLGSSGECIETVRGIGYRLKK
jgi:two-component system, OmpR family, alkaline phosphatase synthesis response regulator PhoP